jgi:hypothetical protein
MVPGEIPGRQCRSSYDATSPIEKENQAGLSTRRLSEEETSRLDAALGHETADDISLTEPRPPGPGPVSESSTLRLAQKQTLWARYQELAADGLSQNQAAQKLGVSGATISRMAATVKAHGLAGLADKYHQSGRKASLALTADEEARLQEIFLKTNRNAEGGSMQTACKFFAHDPQTREELRTVILTCLDKGHLPRFALKVLKQITRAHFAARRKPGMLAANHFAGARGAFARDKFERRRVIESDDATLNFPAWIPCPEGGDPISDKYGVALGRWQVLPALEAGWSHYYLGYRFAARNRGSYRAEDVLSVINLVATHKDAGLPDEFRFERGAWESNRVVDTLERLGVKLTNVYQSNHKPFIESGFSALWTYLSVVDGQVGRFRGEEEEANLDVERCRAGRLDPREVFPSLKQCLAALDGAIAMRNADKIKSVYGSWIPEVRFREHAAERPWRKLTPDLNYLFAPIVGEWTVQKGYVGTSLTLVEGRKTPFYFTHRDLWRSNGQKVRVYFDPAATPCVATVVCIQPHLCFKPGQIICHAELTGELPHFTRAAVGWATPANATPNSGPTGKVPSQRGPLSAVRTETRALSPGGRITRATSEERDGRGATHRIHRATLECGDEPPVQSPLSRAPVNPPRPAMDEETEDLTPARLISSALDHSEDLTLSRPCSQGELTETESL